MPRRRICVRRHDFGNFDVIKLLVLLPDSFLVAGDSMDRACEMHLGKLCGVGAYGLAG